MYENIIAIPFRNRDTHLEYFIKNTVPLFQEYLPNTKVVVIEQNEGKLFNRGALLNVAFKEYENKTKYFFTHDVDINPDEKCIQLLYTNTSFDALRIYVGHNKSLGGICKFTNDSIKAINGFPNYIWGWGIEDRALYYRYAMMNKKISPNYSNAFNFFKLQHAHNGNNTHPNNYNGINSISNNEDNIFKNNDYEKQVKHIMSSGLNNLKYTILERKIIHDVYEVEIIKVEI